MAENLEIVLMHGRVGAGKDMQAKLLADYLETVRETPVHYVSPGDIFRGAGDPLGPYGEYHDLMTSENEVLNSGGLISSEVAVQIFNSYFDDWLVMGERFFIFTGFPRRLDQAESLNQRLVGLSQNNWLVRARHINYVVPEEIARQRTQIRRDDFIARGLEPRADDDPAKVDHRLEVYKQETQPMITKLTGDSRIIILDGTPSIQTVHQNTLAALGLI